MTPSRGMVPADLTRLRFVSDARVSPDGRTVAFVVTTLSEERDEYLSQIWLVDAAGGEPRRFTAGPRRDTVPRWSPDGTRLAFVSEREARYSTIERDLSELAGEESLERAIFLFHAPPCTTRTGGWLTCPRSRLPAAWSSAGYRGCDAPP